MDPFIASLIFGGLSAGGQIIGGTIQQERAKDMNMELWQKTQDWNTPAHQMKLYEDAGLSPKSMLMSGGGSFSPAGSMAAVNPVETPDAGAQAMNYYRMKAMSEQTSMMEIQRQIMEHDYKLIKGTNIPSQSPYWLRGLAEEGTNFMDWLKKESIKDVNPDYLPIRNKKRMSGYTKG